MEESEIIKNNGTDKIFCHVCNKNFDYITASVSSEPGDAIYVCFASIKQKIFVYGKYIGGKYGALSFAKYYTKEECERKVCEENVKGILKSIGEEEYSRFVTCNRGMMNFILLTKQMIYLRKKVLYEGILKEFLHESDGNKKYYCHKHAESSDFKCTCGEQLIRIGSEQDRELTGMEDQKFIERFLPEIIFINPYEKPSCD